MKVIVKLIYKACSTAVFRVGNTLRTSSLKLRLWLNGVHYGSIMSQGTGTVDLRISRSAKSIMFGNNVTFNNFNDAGWNSRCSVWVREGAVLTIGSNTGFNGVLLYSANSVTIGDNVKVGGGTRIFDTDFHPLDYETRRTSNDGTKTAPIIIDDDVFIGAGCLILKGVHIGARSIIAAGSVVVKDIPSDEVWGGNPAKLIRCI